MMDYIWTDKTGMNDLLSMEHPRMDIKYQGWMSPAEIQLDITLL